MRVHVQTHEGKENKLSPVAAAGSGELNEDMDEQMRLTPPT